MRLSHNAGGLVSYIVLGGRMSSLCEQDSGRMNKQVVEWILLGAIGSWYKKVNV